MSNWKAKVCVKGELVEIKKGGICLAVDEFEYDTDRNDGYQWIALMREGITHCEITGADAGEIMALLTMHGIKGKVSKPVLYILDEIP